jgi:hypothetical protein
MYCPGAELHVVKEWVDEKGADITVHSGDTALGRATQARRLDSVKWLVDRTGEDITNVEVYSESFLMFAVACGHSDIVKWLVKSKGADVMEVGQTWTDCVALHDGH